MTCAACDYIRAPISSKRLVGLCGTLQVSVQVDDDLQKTGTTVGEFTMLSSKLMFVGGRPGTTSVEQLTPAAVHNFKGCLKQVRFHTSAIFRSS